MKPSKLHEQNAAFFTALSHRRRQMLCEILLKHSPKGLPFGALQYHSGLSAATLSHHLRFMQMGGIVKRKQKRREIWVLLDISLLRKRFTGFESEFFSA